MRKTMQIAADKPTPSKRAPRYAGLFLSVTISNPKPKETDSTRRIVIEPENVTKRRVVRSGCSLRRYIILRCLSPSLSLSFF